MEAAVQDGSVNAYLATGYSQGVWTDLIKTYYQSGETTEFLTAAGGVCAQHAAWCAGVVIPP
eukprot:1487753-Prymnesium_polylepis.2